MTMTSAASAELAVANFSHSAASALANVNAVTMYRHTVDDADRTHAETIAAAQARHDSAVGEVEKFVAEAQAHLAEVSATEAAALAAVVAEADATRTQALHTALAAMQTQIADTASLVCTPRRDELRPNAIGAPVASITYDASGTTLALRSGTEFRGPMTHEQGHEILLALAAEIATGN